MFDPVAPSKDVFWGLTETGWVAIGSVISALSISLLSLLNLLALREAKRSAKAAESQASAAQSQATAASESLSALNSQVQQQQFQSQQQQLMQKETAIELLEEISRNAVNWKSKLHVDYSGDVRIFPNGWVSVVIFGSQQTEQTRHSIREFEERTSNTEKLLVEFMHQHPEGRKTVTDRTRALLAALDKVSMEARMIARDLREL